MIESRPADPRHFATTPITHGIALIGCVLLLYAVGQPIFTDDLWWHLALGRAFRAGGPWLATDPLLFDAAGPPRPASWLADIALFEASRWGGFAWLRIGHVGAVALILGGVWWTFRRASRSASVASVGVLAFVALAAYRLVQLRPELATIALAIACHVLLFQTPRPSTRRIACFALLAALWANLHAGFLLALLLPAAGALGLLAILPLQSSEDRRGDLSRAHRLTFATVVGALATLANPMGFHAHLAYFDAGGDTPALARIADEWVATSLFTLPAMPRQPSPLAWALAWAMLLALGATIAGMVRSTRSARDPGETRRLDPALLGAAMLAIAMLLSAVRFLWLGFFVWIFVARRWREDRLRWLPPVAASLLLVGFLAQGDWTAITRALPTTWKAYATPYPTGKYSTHAVWLLRDSGVRGNLHADYFLGGFIGYWLAPGVRTLVNGTLNVPRGTLDMVASLAARRGATPDERFTDLLDRLDLDLFLGTRLPETRPLARRFASTTRHLEGVDGWIPIFRAPSIALYLRLDERNAENLDRIARYYAENGVPFHRESGFDALAVAQQASEWAVRHGVVPRSYPRLAHLAQHGADASSASARQRVASIYAALGLYASAVDLDRRTLALRPDALQPRRRLVWSLLHQGAYAEAADAARPLAARPHGDTVSHEIASVAREAADLDPEEARARIHALPIFQPGEARWLNARTVSARARPALD